MTPTPPLVAPDRLQTGEPRFAGAATDWRGALAGKQPAEAVAATGGAFAVATEVAGAGTVLAVDRFGQETLCWTLREGRLSCAARADEFGVREIDPQALFDYLFFHFIPSPRTAFRDVQRLPAGHIGRFDGTRMQVQPYRRPTFKAGRQPSFAALKIEFRELLRSAVERQLEAGVPACFLSGGTDSSTVAGHIRQLAGDVHTYSIGFDAEGYDEMEYARIAARHFGARHHEYYVTPEDLVRHIPAVAAAYDQPFGNSSALPAYCCALRAREDGVTKLLAGDGGDELFGGNTRYATQKVYDIWHRIPAWLRGGLIQPVLALPWASRVSVLRRGRNYVRDANTPLPDRLNHFNLLQRLGTDRVLTPAFLRDVHPDSALQQQRDVWALADAHNDLDRMLAFDWRYTLAESDLPKVRGTSGLAGVKVGYPMLDDALADFSMRLPDSYKVKGYTLRWFFKEALRDFLPEAIISKQKKGFGLPFGVWATKHAALKALATDAVTGFAGRGVVRPEFARTLLEELLPQHPGYYGELVWVLMMLEHWLRHHAPDWRHA